MKIQSVSQFISYLPSVREKEGGQAPEQEGGGQRRQSRQEKEPPPEEEIQTSPELVDQAVEAFRVEMLSKPYPLSATVEGEGLGLRIVLKDESGCVISRMAGVDFLRLRRSSNKAGQVRGKILDRKL